MAHGHMHSTKPATMDSYPSHIPGYASFHRISPWPAHGDTSSNDSNASNNDSRTSRSPWLHIVSVGVLVTHGFSSQHPLLPKRLTVDAIHKIATPTQILVTHHYSWPHLLLTSLHSATPAIMTAPPATIFTISATPAAPPATPAYLATTSAYDSHNDNWRSTTIAIPATIPRAPAKPGYSYSYTSNYYPDTSCSRHTYS